MTGDGLQDIVLVHDGNVEYWPNLGHGDWGKRGPHAQQPALPDPATIPADAMPAVGDVDGDGAGRPRLRRRRRGDALDQPERQRLERSDRDPRHAAASPTSTRVRLVDLLGNGVSGVLWSTDADGLAATHCSSSTSPAASSRTCSNEMDNHIGAVTRVALRAVDALLPGRRAAPRDALEDAAAVPGAGGGARRGRSTQISGGKLTTEYRYHHGYWDGAEREFRGFGRVEQRDTEVVPAGTASGRRSAPRQRRIRRRSRRGPGSTRGRSATSDDWLCGADCAASSGPATRRCSPATGGRSTLAGLTAARRGATRCARCAAASCAPSSTRSTARRARACPTRSPSIAYGAARGGRAPRRCRAARASSSPSPSPSAPPVGARRRPDDQFAFTADYDAFGQPRNQIAIAVPRGRDPARRAGALRRSRIWSPRASTAYRGAERDAVHRRPRRARHELRDRGERTRSVPQLRDALLAGAGLERKVIGQTLSFYDGAGVRGPAARHGRRRTARRAQRDAGADAGDSRRRLSGRPAALLRRRQRRTGASIRTRSAAACRRMPAICAATASAGTPFVTGLYAVTVRREYDFQRTATIPRAACRARHARPARARHHRDLRRLRAAAGRE